MITQPPILGAKTLRQTVRKLQVAVLINGEKVAAHFRGSSKPPYTFKISPNQIQDGLVDITFAIKDAISPKAIGISEDTRQIAFV